MSLNSTPYKLAYLPCVGVSFFLHLVLCAMLFWVIEAKPWIHTKGSDEFLAVQSIEAFVGKSQSVIPCFPHFILPPQQEEDSSPVYGIAPLLSKGGAIRNGLLGDKDGVASGLLSDWLSAKSAQKPSFQINHSHCLPNQTPQSAPIAEPPSEGGAMVGGVCQEGGAQLLGGAGADELDKTNAFWLGAVDQDDPQEDLKRGDVVYLVNGSAASPESEGNLPSASVIDGVGVTPIDEARALSALDGTVDWSDYFELLPGKIELVSKEQGVVAFSFKLKPLEKLHPFAIKKKIIFAINGSSALDRKTRALFLQAIKRAIVYCDGIGNILFVGQDLVSIFPSDALFQTISQAEWDFFSKKALSIKSHKGSDYETISPVFLKEIDESALNLFFLCSNEIVQPYRRQPDSREVALFSSLQKDPLVLFCAALGEATEFPKLMELTALLGGGNLFSDTRTAFPRKFAKMVRDASEIIAYHVRVSGSSGASPLTRVWSCANELYEEQEISFLGLAPEDSVVEFVLSAQHGPYVVEIKKSIDISLCKRGQVVRENPYWKQVSFDKSTLKSIVSESNEEQE